MSNILELNLADLQKAIRDKNLSAKEITCLLYTSDAADEV